MMTYGLDLTEIYELNDFHIQMRLPLLHGMARNGTVHSVKNFKHYLQNGTHNAARNIDA